MTLNNFNDLFEQIADNHLQIKRFGYGEILSDIEDMISRSQEFPVMWVQLIEVQYPQSLNVKQYTFNVLLFDILSNDKSNEGEVISDMYQISEDIIKFLQWDGYDFEIIGTPKVTAFTERFSDFVAGVNLNITLQVDFNGLDSCDTGLINTPIIL